MPSFLYVLPSDKVRSIVITDRVEEGYRQWRVPLFRYVLPCDKVILVL